MTLPRSAQVSLDDTPYYHCIARCVRRAFLCGEDRYSGQNFNHRRQWLVDRLKLQASLFSIDICAYAIMSNHYHVVLKIDRDRALSWSDDEVMERWCGLFRGPILVQNYLAGLTLCQVELDTVSAIAEVWRQRLSNISWFMRCLNEFIARQANQEDHCSGRFWEGRFKSQALLDTRAVLSCMAYVDLNPVRAGMAGDLMGSDFTSIQERLLHLANQPSQPLEPNMEQVSQLTKGLLPFLDNDREAAPGESLPFTLTGYIDLVEWTGRMVKADKRGSISPTAPKALEAIGINSEQWLELSLTTQRLSLQAIGNPVALQRYNQSTGRLWSGGQARLKMLYSGG